jgi:hypothetical protein
MAGSANTPPDANLAQALTQAGIAAFKVAGTGTSLDGKWVIGAMLIDPDTGAVYKAGGGTGGGAVTVADGADVALGQVSDASADFGGPASLIKLAAAIWKRLRGGQATKANSMPVVLASDSDALPVTGTFWQATQPVSQSAAAATSATLQNAAGATGNGTPLAVAGMSVVVFTVGGASGPNATVTFEGTEDGTNYQSLIAANLGTGMQSGTASVTTTPTLYVASVGGLTAVRARISAWVAGTVTVTAHTTIAAYEPRVVQLSDGTTQLSVQAIGTGQNAATVAGGFKELSGLSAGSLNADLVPSTDVSAYRWLSLHIGSNAYSGTLTFQGSNDGANFVSVSALNASSTGSTAPASTVNTTSVIFAIPVQFRYLRIRMTSYSSGAAQATLEMFTTPASGYPSPTLAVGQSGSWLTAVFPAKVAQAISNGQNTTPSIDTSFGTVTNHTSKASAGNVFSVHASSINSALVWFQIFNKASAPTSPGEVPIYSFPLPAGSATVPGVVAISENFFGIAGKNFATGIAWGISSTQATFTDAGTASNYGVHVHYV